MAGIAQRGRDERFYINKREGKNDTARTKTAHKG